MFLPPLSHEDREIRGFFTKFSYVMFLNFLLFFLSILSLVGSAIASMMASFTTATVVSLCAATIVTMLSVGYISHSVIVGYTLSHLAQCTEERTEQQLLRKGAGCSNGSGAAPVTSKEAEQPGGAIRGAPAIEEGSSRGRGFQVAQEC